MSPKPHTPTAAHHNPLSPQHHMEDVAPAQPARPRWDARQAVLGAAAISDLRISTEMPHPSHCHHIQQEADGSLCHRSFSNQDVCVNPIFVPKKWNKANTQNFFRTIAEVSLDRTAYSHMNLFNNSLIFKYRFNTFLFFYRYIYSIVHLNLQSEKTLYCNS